MKLKDQNFEVGDRVIVIGSDLKIYKTTITDVKIDQPTYAIHIGLNFEAYTRAGQTDTNRPQVVFHKDAVTIDEYDRLLSIDYDYIKEIAPIVTKEPHEFYPFERVLVRSKDSEFWRCNFFSYFDASNTYPFCCTGLVYMQCIPFEGNEHICGKVTK